MELNRRALRIVDRMRGDGCRLNITVQVIGEATVLDCGVHARGGIQAGLELARVCLADLADVQLAHPDDDSLGLPRVVVVSDQPVAACMASQYAGWQIQVGKFFAMGSGPMRAAYGKERLFDEIGFREKPAHVVGVLETSKLPTEEVLQYLSEKLSVPTEKITLLVAATRSLAGGTQVVARALEMALHKLHELHFDLKQIHVGQGCAPLPPPAADDLTALGRTNDAILYGGRVVLWVDTDDDYLRELGPKVPASASTDFGSLFSELFGRYKDFYKMDPLLFSPALITFCNLRSGRVHTFGRTEPAVLRRSFGF
jgi:methenyltetrahydromethanopterin cyclohydrolase